MTVKLLDNASFYGYRVRRTIDSRVYQEYFSLKREGVRLEGTEHDEVLAAAEARDKELAQLQRQARRARKLRRCFHQDGSVRGISFLLKTEKSGAQTPIFQVGIASELEKKVVCTSFSLNAHGREKAWEKAVEAYARHKAISPSSPIYQRLLAAIPEVEPELKEG